MPRTKLLFCVAEASCLTSGRLSPGAPLEVTSKSSVHQGGLSAWGSPAARTEAYSEHHGGDVPMAQAPWLSVPGI